MSKVEIYQHRIQRKINPGDTRFNVNDLDFTIYDRRIFFWNSYCYNKKYDFILLENDKFKIGLQHQYIANNIMDSVIGAGSITIDPTGYVLEIDNQSGTFQFNHNQQQEYLGKIHTIVNLQFCKVYNIDYSKEYDPTKPALEPVKNRFYNPIQLEKEEGEKYRLFEKEITTDKFREILKANKFDYDLYYKLNLDLAQTYTINQQDLLIDHFYTHGQYERGRGVGYY